MDIAWALLFVPPFILPFIRKWSLSLSQIVFGFVAAFSLLSIWSLLTNWSNMSECLSWLFVIVIALCLAVILISKHFCKKLAKVVLRVRPGNSGNKDCYGVAEGIRFRSP